MQTGTETGAKSGGGYGAIIGGVIGLIVGGVELLAEGAKTRREINESIVSDTEATNRAVLRSYEMSLMDLSTIQEQYKTMYGKSAFDLGFTASAESIKEASKQLEQYNSILASYNIRTIDKHGKKKDEYTALLDIYPDLIDSQGRLNQATAEAILNGTTLNDVQKETVQRALDASTGLEDAYANMADYLASIFDGLSSDVMNAFQEMYISGTDNMDGLQVSFSDMIEKLTTDMIQSALLQPIIDQLREATNLASKSYAYKEISSAQLQQILISQLGSFYSQVRGIQPQVDQAYKEADKLAAAAGFDSAFNNSDSSSSSNNSSTAGAIAAAITEATGTELVGRMNAVMLSNERIANNSDNMSQLAAQNLALMNKLVINTDYLPEIAANTRKTWQKLDTI
jgi:hypothetical protein